VFVSLKGAPPKKSKKITIDFIRGYCDKPRFKSDQPSEQPPIKNQSKTPERLSAEALR